MIGFPPLAGAVQVSRALVLPAAALSAVGAAGVVAGVTAAVGSEAGPVPAPFVAETVKV